MLIGRRKKEIISTSEIAGKICVLLFLGLLGFTDCFTRLELEWKERESAGSKRKVMIITTERREKGIKK